LSVIGELVRARGRASPKIAYADKTVTGTADFLASDFGLTRIIAPISASVLNASSTIPTQTVEITGWDSTKVSVVVIDHTVTAGAEHAVSGTARTVRVVVIGE
jgi:hypothetical protein